MVVIVGRLVIGLCLTVVSRMTVAGVPIVELFGVGDVGGLDKVQFGVRLSDPEYAYRDEYRGGYVNKELRLVWLPSFGASGVVMTVGYCSMMQSMTSGDGRVTTFTFVNRLGRLGGWRPRTNGKASQRAFHSDDSGLDVAQDSLNISWGSSPKS